MRFTAAHGLSWLTGRPFVRPSKLILLLTHRCPLRCAFCSTHRWHRVRPAELALVDWERRLEEAAAWGIDELLFSGGEPLLRLGDVLALTRRARTLGQIPTLITSGAVGDRATVDELADAGTGSFMVSIDGATAATHDALRLRPGGFDEALAWVTAAVAAREQRRDPGAPSPPFTVYVQTVVQEANAGELVPLAGRLRDLGVDGLLLQGLAPDAYLEQHDLSPGGQDRLAESVRALARFEPRSFVMSSDGYLETLPRYYAGWRGAEPRRCLAGYDVLVLAPDGSVSSCRESETRAILAPDGSPLPLREAWTHPRFRAARRTMRTCGRPCLINCWYTAD